jgi:hypothetical protein
MVPKQVRRLRAFAAGHAIRIPRPYLAAIMISMRLAMRILCRLWYGVCLSWSPILILFLFAFEKNQPTKPAPRADRAALAHTGKAPALFHLLGGV